MSHKKFGPDRFSRFEFIGYTQTDKQTNKQTDKPNLYLEAIKRNYVLKQTSLLSTKYLCNNTDTIKNWQELGIAGLLQEKVGVTLYFWTESTL